MVRAHERVRVHEQVRVLKERRKSIGTGGVYCQLDKEKENERRQARQGQHLPPA
ncbi:hypothetical protein AMTR_s00093p00092030 [Amborella trichopoda]|uniref:Uncharacterized protein n=1 Tax=Amborella trichopoda TaxID=13333 RepID=W1NVV3_AMBTC|nr:hypothetical protein AMTR_s00093p00092030 [Amborella trichopoda]